MKTTARTVILLVLLAVACGGRNVAKKGVPVDDDDNNVANNEPANNEPANNDPANNEPANNEPANNDPGNNNPGNNDPGNNDPGNNDPGNNDPLLDRDGDGFTQADGDCCDSASDGCSNPAQVNPAAFDFAGNLTDDDCDGTADNTPSCTATEQWGGANGMSLSAGLGLCSEHGLLNAELTGADGTGTPDFRQTTVARKFGSLINARAGQTMAVLSSGAASGVGDPGYESNYAVYTDSVGPADYLVAHGGELPAVAGCAAGGSIHDSVRLQVTLQVPSNARGFEFDFRFFSEEYPDYVCSMFNDYFLVLLDGSAPGVPADRNIALDPLGNPITVNSDVITTCAPTTCEASNGCAGARSCSGGMCVGARGACPEGNAELAAFTDSEGGSADSFAGGGSSWLRTTAPVVAGETVTLEFHIWDTSDSIANSTVLLDGFRWLATTPVVQTVPAP